MNWPALDFTGLANAVLLLTTTCVIALATAIGRRTKKVAAEPQSTGVAIEGAAIVSSEPIVVLTNAISANTVALALQHQDAEKERALQHQIVEALRSSAEETNDLRQAVQNLTLEFVRGR